MFTFSNNKRKWRTYMGSETNTINVLMKDKEGKEFPAVVVIRDGYAVVKFGKEDVAKKLFEINKKKGVKNQIYISSVDAIAEKYRGKTCEQITEIIKKEVIAQGGKLL